MRRPSLSCDQIRSLANGCAITHLFSTYFDTVIISLLIDCSACYLSEVKITRTIILAMTSSEHRPPISMRAFERWVASATRGEQIAYYHGFLILDRSPGSKLTAERRRQLARLADAALRAAGSGHVCLVQQRRGPFDFAYLAIKAGVLESTPAARMRQALGRSAA